MTVTASRAASKCRPARMLVLAAGACGLLCATGCTRDKAASTIDSAKMAAVEIGRSSRADVFTTLGRPNRTERSNAGERWIYEDGRQSQGSGQFVSGVGLAAGMVGAFVPFAGLVGPGLGLASAASGAPPADPAGASLAVDFSTDGLVRDCVYSSGAMPAGLPGAASSLPSGCGRARTAP